MSDSVGTILSIYLLTGLAMMGLAIGCTKLLRKYGRPAIEAETALDSIGWPFLLAVGSLVWPLLVVIVAMDRTRK